MTALDERIENPEKFEIQRKEKYHNFKHQRLSQLTTGPTIGPYSQDYEPLPHEVIFERSRPQEMRHTKVNDKDAVKRRAKAFQTAKIQTLAVIKDQEEIT